MNNSISYKEKSDKTSNLRDEMSEEQQLIKND